MRQIVLDTETTGLEVEKNHRVIEIGCVELVNRRITGRKFHHYLNPDRDIDKGAQEVHGITRERLEKEPRFKDIQGELTEFIRGAELIIHNAGFDIGFLDAEYRLEQAARGGDLLKIADLCTVLDTLALARRLHPGQRNSLDALCKRYSIDNSHRDYHGALLDARILAEVYLAMTGGQAILTLNAEADSSAARTRRRQSESGGGRVSIPIVAATEEELQAHERLLSDLDKASRGKTVWRM